MSSPQHPLTGAHALLLVLLTVFVTLGCASAEAPPATGRSDTTTPAEPPSSAANSDHDCGLQVQLTLSETIGTVAIVTFTSDVDGLDGGYVEFGQDETYGVKAPLDLSAEGYRAVLLGMVPDTSYHYRVVAQFEATMCTGKDGTFTTGSAPADAPKPTLEVAATDRVAPGFIVGSTTVSGSGSGTKAAGYMFIYTNQGELVWWHQSSITAISRSRISWDGKYIYGRDANPGARPGGNVIRVALDGSGEALVAVDTGHHDMTVTPDNGLLFLTGGGRDGCGTITKLSADESQSPFYDLRDAFGDSFNPGEDPCHCNSIHYNPSDKTVSVSCLNQNAYVKLTDTGELVWVLGGNNNQSHFDGDVAWSRQHGHHMLGDDRIVFFNNNNAASGNNQLNSLAVELKLDLELMTATRVWEYAGGYSSITFGDAQRLANGNTLITYSNAGVIHEVDADKSLVQAWTFRTGIGYLEHRPSLYGAPSRP